MHGTVHDNHRLQEGTRYEWEALQRSGRPPFGEGTSPTIVKEVAVLPLVKVGAPTPVEEAAVLSSVAVEGHI